MLPARQFPGAGLVIVAACILAIGLALLALSPNYGRQFDPGLPPHRDARVTINAAYGGYGKLRDDDTLIVNEHITLGQVSARGGGILDIAVPGGRRSLLISLRSWLLEHGWGTRPPCDGDFCRARPVRTVGLPTLFPAERTTKVRAPALPDELGLADRFTSIPVRVTLSDDSRLTLDSPPNAIGETFPSATRGAGPGDTERFELPMPGYAKAVELDVRNHLFRHAVLVPVVDLTVWAPFAWLVAVAAAMISEGARAFLTRGWRRLLGRASPRLRPSS